MDLHNGVERGKNPTAVKIDFPEFILNEYEDLPKHSLIKWTFWIWGWLNKMFFFKIKWLAGSEWAKLSCDKCLHFWNEVKTFIFMRSYLESDFFTPWLMSVFWAVFSYFLRIITPSDSLLYISFSYWLYTSKICSFLLPKHIFKTKRFSYGSIKSVHWVVHGTCWTHTKYSGLMTGH